MKTSKTIQMVVIVLAGLFMMAAAQTATAQEQGWEFTADLYGWGASIGGRSATGTGIDIGIDDLIDNLEMGLMTSVGARKGKWSILTDVIYMDVDAGKHGIDVGLQSWIVTPVVGYNLVQDGNIALDIVGGARYLWLKSELDLSGVGGARFSDSGHVWDGIVGLKGEVTLAKNWYIPFYLDVGAGDSDLTWQALGGLAYKFKKFDVVAGYRYLDWEFDDNDVFDDLNLSGLYAGLKLQF